MNIFTEMSKKGQLHWDLPEMQEYFVLCIPCVLFNEFIILQRAPYKV